MLEKIEDGQLNWNFRSTMNKFSMHISHMILETY